MASNTKMGTTSNTAISTPTATTMKTKKNENKRSILCFGDSLTAGYHDVGRKFYPYASLLQKLLLNDDDMKDKIYNVDYCGQCGWTTEQMLNGANKNNQGKDVCGRDGGAGIIKRIESGNYDYVIILSGTNDLAFGDDENKISNNLIIDNNSMEC